MRRVLTCWGWRVVAASVLGLALGIASRAAGQTAPPAEAGEGGTYERQRMSKVLAELGLERAPAPEGKTIAFVRVVRHDVFVEDELWPTFPNLFHWRTEEAVVRRELRFGEGDAYRRRAIQESMRNLRSLGVFALVRIAAVQTEDPDQVGVVVHTRDLWSLRTELDFAIVDTAVNNLAFQLVERNLFGRNKTASARLQLFPKTYRVGQAFVDYRLFGGELRLVESFDVIFNKARHEAEGSVATVRFGRPFYNLAQRWSFDVQAGYDVHVERPLRRGEVVRYDIPDTPRVEAIPRVWDDRSYQLRGTVTYRRGRRFKQGFTLGLGAADRRVRPHAEAGLMEEQHAAFVRDVLPRVRRQVYPLLGYQLWLPEYVVLENLGSFGRSEAVRVGPVLSAELTLPLEVFGSSTSSFTAAGELGYVAAWGGSFLSASLKPSARLEEGKVINQLLTVHLRYATPPWLAGRLVARIRWEGRRRDRDRTSVSLGGDNGLRGYTQQAFQTIGGNLLLGNLEYRTLPVEWEAVHLGAVAFYDAGSVYAHLEDAVLRQSAGLGLRVLLPHFNQFVFRGDAGMPLDGSGFRVTFTLGTHQAVPLTEEEDLATTDDA